MKSFFYIYSKRKKFTIKLLPILGPPNSLRWKFIRTWISTTWGCLNTNLSFSSRLIFKIHKHCYPYNCLTYKFFCENLTPPHFVPTLRFGIMIWAKLNLHFLMLLPHKLQLIRLLRNLKDFPLYNFLWKFDPITFWPTLPKGSYIE